MMTTLKKALMTAVAPTTATYLSADEVERADARTLGYETVCRQPKSARATESVVLLPGGFVARAIQHTG